MNKLIVFFPFLFWCVQSFAQDTIIVHKDPRIDILNTKRSLINITTSKMSSSGKFRGYRVQVLSTRSRDEALRIKAELVQKFSDHQSFLLFQLPYYRLRIGNFINKEDAEKLKKQLLQYYKQGVFVVEDLIDSTTEQN